MVNTKVKKEEIIHSKWGHATAFLRIVENSDKVFRIVLSRDKVGKDTVITFTCPNERTALSTFDFIKRQFLH